MALHMVGAPNCKATATRSGPRRSVMTQAMIPRGSSSSGGGVPQRRSLYGRVPPVLAQAHGFDREHETPQQAQERRMRESAQVESRVAFVEDFEDLQERLVLAGDNLVVLEIQSEIVCESGIPETAELHWRQDQRAAEAASRDACHRIKHTVQRTARECEDVVFLEMFVPDDESGDALKAQLGVELLPTLQFIRHGQVLWQEQGYEGMEQDMGEAVLYYGGGGGAGGEAGGKKATELVPDLTTPQQLNDFVRNTPSPDTLVVLDISTTMCKPCIKVYPAVVALARSFQGHARFARLLADEVPAGEAIMRTLDIKEVPAFVFFRGGREVGRMVSSGRGDLIGHILQLQADAGIRPPPPPPRQAASKRRTATTAANRWR